MSAFATDEQFLRVAAHVAGIERHQFGKTQAGAIEGFEYGVVAAGERVAVGGRYEQFAQFVGGEGGGQFAARDFGDAQFGGRIVGTRAALLQPAEVVAQGGAVLGEGTRADCLRNQPVLQGGGVKLVQVPQLMAEIGDISRFNHR